MKKSLILLVLSLSFGFGISHIFFNNSDNFESSKVKIPDFTLFTLNKKAFRLYEKKDVRGIVLFTYGIGCPIAQQQLPYLNTLYEEYKSKGIEFYLLVSDLHLNEESLKKEKKQFEIIFPILVDKAQSIAKLLNISRTAEAILINTKSFNLVSRGPLNDKFGYGSQKDEITHNYLKESIDALLSNKAVKTSYVEPKGCLLSLDSNKQTKISFSKEVVPILKRNCLSCHFDGGTAPWSMKSYSKIKRWSQMMKEVVLTKRMPPRFIYSELGEFSANDIHGLAPSDEMKLFSWIDQGAEKDFSEKDPLKIYHDEISKESKGWPWGKPDLILSLNEPLKVPASGWYNMEVNEVEDQDLIKKDTWVKAIYIKPGNARVVHHISIFAHNTDKNKQIQTVLYVKKKSWGNNKSVKALMDKGMFDWNSDLGQLIKSNKETLIDTSDVVGELVQRSQDFPYEKLGSYNAGKQVDPFPNKTGRFLPKGTSFVFLSHYKTIGVATEDNTKAGLYFYKNPDVIKNLQPFHHLFIQGNFFNIPANEKMQGTFYHVIENDITVYAVAAHLHYRGRSQKIIAHFPDDVSKILFHEPNYQYDFNHWEYYFKKPIKLPKGTLLESIAEFDNTIHNTYNPSPNEPRKFGYQLNEEMFWAALVYSDDVKEKMATEMPQQGL